MTYLFVTNGTINVTPFATDGHFLPPLLTPLGLPSALNLCSTYFDLWLRHDSIGTFRNVFVMIHKLF